MSAKFLLDSNCWLQIVRNRENAAVMARFKSLDQFPKFIESSRIGDTVGVIRLAPSDLINVVANALLHRLDFDDAYQYIAADMHGLRIVSFDTDFDRTPNGRLTPAAALKLFTDEQQKR